MKMPFGRSVSAGSSGKGKRFLFLTIALAFISSPMLCQTEPDLRIEVIAGGNQLLMNDGDTIELNGEMVIIRTQKVRTFRLSGLRFDYPRDYGFNFVENAAFRSWVLDGNNFIIMLFEFPEKHDLQKVVKEMVHRFGKKNCTVIERKIRLNQNEMNGKRILVDLLGARITFDLFPIELTPDRSHVLAFQDTKTDRGTDSVEGLETMDLLAQSFTIEKK